MKKRLIIVQRGFTLIELLVVIAIIGILAAVITVSFTSSQRQARDTQRKSDLTQFRTALESYANLKDGIYPVHATAINITSADLCDASELNLSVCPTDPKNGTQAGFSGYTYGYYYLSDATGIKYTLYAYLENTPKFWVICSNGTNLTKSSLPNISDCP